jgi:D-serine deaminase-like pyridoxal phosphate-dependent protein
MGRVGERSTDRWNRYRSAIAEVPLPCAIVDLEALEANVAHLASLLQGTGKGLRIATKSVRCPDLVTRIRDTARGAARGLMTYTAAETAYWAARGERDLLLAYPTASRGEADLLAEANATGATAAIVADAAGQLEAIAAAGRSRGVRVPVLLEVDLAWRPLGALVHLGVRRSPLREPSDVIALARRVAATPGLRFHGVMGYEAQVAGVPDAGAAVLLMKALSRADVARRRAELARALQSASLPPVVFNGGGTGSLAACAREQALTEVTAGSGFLDSHLFDAYGGLDLSPAAFFVLRVVRRPGPHLVTCHGGGYVASGAAGRDRLPVPALPEGLRLLPLEGAGEVQTPLAEPKGVHLALGDPVFFRHAKAGELAEHFAEYHLVRGALVEDRAPTYRGLGKCFLG